jgi:hypothetical protein
MTKYVSLLLCLLLFAPVEVLPSFSVQAYPLEPQKISVILLSPENRSYRPDVVNLSFRVSHWQDADVEAWFTIDGQAPMKLYLSGYQGSVGASEHVSGLHGLGEGSHVVKVWASGKDSYSEAQVTFTVDCTVPTITDISLENKTYTATDRDLVCRVDEPFSWIAYSLDNQANVTVKMVPYYFYSLSDKNGAALQANATLTGLSEGPHNLVVYANDTAGNMGASEKIMFTVDVPDPFPSGTILVAASAIAIAAAALLLAYRRHKRNRHRQSGLP